MYHARIRSSDRSAVENTLYLLMSQALKSTSLERLTTAGAVNVFDQYRQLYFEGLNITELSLFNAKGKIWRAPEARSAKDLPSAIERWEADRNFLRQHAGMNMDEDDQKYNILMIAPERDAEGSAEELHRQ